ncbi:thioesterase [Xenorhabdus sp. DI]|uniref:thioesterase II family protein n=1 Tax=Xenorhabdus doucetiae TaxID=351671 RepID=UPI0019BFD7C3|nr:MULTISPECIES: thioesterase domain-containing protein [unclassified Xenorhabdus]MBD2784466.1 thioesterase [Xenorhabdus sp. 3]MBD2789274.1 thioesterase [Xenorhabdus sp. DI]
MSELDMLICFPYAGGGVCSFELIKKHVSNRMKVISLSYSINAQSESEQSITSFNALLGNLKKQLNEFEGKITLFGHSMGAIVAYELALLCADQLNIQKLVVSACKPPELLVNSKIFSSNNDRLFEKIVCLGGLPQVISSNPIRLKNMKYKLLHDLQMISNYKRNNYPRINCAIHALSASDDFLASENDMKLWKNYTNKEFRETTFDGDHFYFRNKSKEVAKFIS